MIIKDLIERLRKFDDRLPLMIVSKQGNDKGFNAIGAELNIFDCSTNKLDYPEKIIKSENRQLVCTIFGDKE